MDITIRCIYLMWLILKHRYELNILITVYLSVRLETSLIQLSTFSACRSLVWKPFLTKLFIGYDWRCSQSRSRSLSRTVRRYKCTYENHPGKWKMNVVIVNNSLRKVSISCYLQPKHCGKGERDVINNRFSEIWKNDTSNQRKGHQLEIDLQNVFAFTNHEIVNVYMYTKYLFNDNVYQLKCAELNDIKIRFFQTKS